jgi:hypothetical protein
MGDLSLFGPSEYYFGYGCPGLRCIIPKPISQAPRTDRPAHISPTDQGSVSNRIVSNVRSIEPTSTAQTVKHSSEANGPAWRPETLELVLPQLPPPPKIITPVFREQRRVDDLSSRSGWVRPSWVWPTLPWRARVPLVAPQSPIARSAFRAPVARWPSGTMMKHRSPIPTPFEEDSDDDQEEEEDEEDEDIEENAPKTATRTIMPLEHVMPPRVSRPNSGPFYRNRMASTSMASCIEIDPGLPIVRDAADAGDWNAIAVMDALTGRCLVQTFNTSSSGSDGPKRSASRRLVIMAEENSPYGGHAHGGRVWIGGIWDTESATSEAFEYDLLVQDSSELQRALCVSTKEARDAIRRQRQLRPLRGSALQKAIVDLQIQHGMMAVWPRCLPPLFSSERAPLVLEPLESVLDRNPTRNNNVAAYVVCENRVYALFNRAMQIETLTNPQPVSKIKTTNPTSIRIFAPDQLRSWIAATLTPPP